MYTIIYRVNNRSKKMVVSAGNVGDTLSRLEIGGFKVTRVEEVVE